MPDKCPRVARSSRVATTVAVAVPVLLGLLLLGLGIPRTVAAWWSLEAEPVMDKMQAGRQSMSEAELVAAKEATRSALRWVPSSRRLATLGTLELLEARLQPLGDPKRLSLLAEAESHLVAALIRNPADSVAWFNLALVRTAKGSDGRQIAEALVGSLRMAPHKRDLWTPRAALLLRHWRFLDEGELREFRSQLRTIYAQSLVDRAKLLEAAIDLGEMRFTAAALGEDALAEEAYEQLKAELDRPAVTAPKTPAPASRRH